MRLCSATSTIIHAEKQVLFFSCIFVHTQTVYQCGSGGLCAGWREAQVHCDALMRGLNHTCAPPPNQTYTHTYIPINKYIQIYSIFQFKDGFRMNCTNSSHCAAKQTQTLLRSFVCDAVWLWLGGTCVWILCEIERFRWVGGCINLFGYINVVLRYGNCIC